MLGWEKKLWSEGTQAQVGEVCRLIQAETSPPRSTQLEGFFAVVTTTNGAALAIHFSRRETRQKEVGGHISGMAPSLVDWAGKDCLADLEAKLGTRGQEPAVCNKGSTQWSALGQRSALAAFRSFPAGQHTENHQFCQPRFL